MDEENIEKEEATKKALEVLEEWGSESKFIWFRELHRITDIDKGMLRNIINDLKKSKDLAFASKDTQRIFFCLKKHYKRCQDFEKRFKKNSRKKDGNKSGAFQEKNRTKKRLEKQKIKRQVKAYTKSKSRAKLKNRTRPHKS